MYKAPSKLKEISMQTSLVKTTTVRILNLQDSIPTEASSKQEKLTISELTKVHLTSELLLIQTFTTQAT